MRQRAEYSTRSNKNSFSSSSSEIGLFDDVAVMEKDEQSFVIGRVERIVLRGERGRKYYKRPVMLNADNKDKLDITIAKYPFLGEEGECFAYSLDNCLLETKKFKDVIASVDLTATNDKLLMEKDVHAEIETVVDDACSRTRTSRNARKRTQTSVDTIFDERDFAPVDGEVVTVVEPAEDDTGLRRSKRTRRVIVRDSR